MDELFAIKPGTCIKIINGSFKNVKCCTALYSGASLHREHVVILMHFY